MSDSGWPSLSSHGFRYFSQCNQFHADCKRGATLFQPPTEWGVSTTPQPGLNHRCIPIAHGRLLGGSTSLNGTLVVRGLKSDFDAWRIPGWDGNTMFEHMRRAEDFNAKSWFEHHKDAHGQQGVVRTEPQALAPISELCLESFQSAGLSLHPDMFSSGETSKGCGHAVRTTHGGERSTAASYLNCHIPGQVAGSCSRDAHLPSNIHLATSMMVDKVLLESVTADSPPDHDHRPPYRASSVVLRDSRNGTVTAHARNDIIISAGTYHTPGILQRSGIGPPSLLNQLDIPTLVPLPDVGRNLRDHLICSILYKLKPSATYTLDGRPLTKDAVWHFPSGFNIALDEWKNDKTGYMASFPFGAFAYADLSSRLADLPDAFKAQKAPHVELFNTECYFGPPEYGQHPKDGSHVFAMTVMLLHPQSTGTVMLPNVDATSPDAKPVVDHGFLGDENNIDIRVLTEGCMFADQLIREGEGTKNIVEGTWPPNDDRNGFTARGQWMQWVRNNATTCYHPVGSCRMGRVKGGNEDAVVDERLRVRGVQGLRVADCSIMPTLNSGHTQMVAYAIGEKAASIMKENAASGGHS